MIKPNYALFDGQRELIAVNPVAFYAWWTAHDHIWHAPKEPAAICPACMNWIWTAPGRSMACPCGEITLTRRLETNPPTVVADGAA